jgi:hypothetical protein
MQDITSKQMERQVDLWEQVREQVYTCFKRAGDALFNLTDALLSESQAKSLAELSLSPSFQRKWPSVYEALEDGTIDVAKLRAVWVEALLAQSEPEELIWIAVDSSVIERPDAHTSEDRGIIHLSNLPLVNKPIGVGWTVSSVVLLPDAPSSWVPILDVQRVATSQTPIGVAIAQLQALKPLLGKRRVILLADRGYCTPKFLRACHELGISVIVRMKSDRRLYRPPVRLHPKGPMRHPTVPFSKASVKRAMESLKQRSVNWRPRAKRCERADGAICISKRTGISRSKSFAWSEKRQKTPNVIPGSVGL